MSVITVTHINLRGQARQALEFYQSVFGGQVTAITYQDFGIVQDPADAGLIVWGQVRSENGFHIMAYDVPAAEAWNQGEKAFFVSLRGETTQEVTSHWEKLCHGGTIVRALSASKWSPLYGMLKDQFGVTWVVDVAAQ